jgi:spore photoproduct lyase
LEYYFQGKRKNKQRKGSDNLDPWMPERVYFEPSARETVVGKRIQKFCEDNHVPILYTTSHNQVRDLPGKDEKSKYAAAKKTLVVGIKKSMKLEVCKPSAHYQFSLTTNCPGNCEYCYLYSTQAKKPFVRVYVNMEELYGVIDEHIKARLPHATMFEAASTGDPLAVEHITGTLKDTIEHFGTLEKGRMRLVTKFSNVDSLLTASHNKHTRIRFSITTPYVIKNFEHNVSSLQERMKAARKIMEAGYPIGFLIAPIMIHENWRNEFEQLFEELHEHMAFKDKSFMTFELIQHRFTIGAKKAIEERFPNTKLEMNPHERIKKWGKYGKVKYIYNKDESMEIKNYIENLIKKHFKYGHIQYFT